VTDSKSCVSGQAAAPGVAKRSRALGGRPGSGCGGQVPLGLQEDSLAGEVFELAGQVALAALLVDPRVVVAGAEVVVAGVRVGQDVPDDRGDGVADRDDGAFLAASAGQTAVAVAEEGVGAGQSGDDLAEGPGEPEIAFAGGRGLSLARPADCLSMGANLAQDTRCAAVGKGAFQKIEKAADPSLTEAKLAERYAARLEGA